MCLKICQMWRRDWSVDIRCLKASLTRKILFVCRQLVWNRIADSEIAFVWNNLLFGSADKLAFVGAELVVVVVIDLSRWRHKCGLSLAFDFWQAFISLHSYYVCVSTMLTSYVWCLIELIIL